MNWPLCVVVLGLALCVVGADTAAGASSEPVCGTPAAIFCEDFETGTLPGIWEDGYQPLLHSLTTTSANVFRGQRALQATYSAGSDGGGWLTKWFMPGYEHTY